MSSFECNYTCPVIDQNIDFMKKIFEREIKFVIRDLSPKFSDTSEAKSYAQKVAEELYESIETEIEKVRETNIKMRKEAEEQIEKLQDTIDTLNKKKTK